MSHSQVFYPYRAVGLYSGSVPFAIHRRKTVHFVTVPIDKTFQTFNCEKLTVCGAGPIFPHQISAVCVRKDRVFVASGDIIYVCIRAKKIKEIKGHISPIKLLFALSNLLVSYSEDNLLKIWNCKTGILQSEIQLPKHAHVSVIMHPITYLNKLLIATREGYLQLWNIRTMELIYTFSGWGSAVNCVVQSPAVDIVGIGLEDGRIILHNLKYDKSLFSFNQDLPVAAMAFRTDGTNILSTTSPKGQINTWDLEKRKLIQMKPDAHRGLLHSAYFFHCEPILITAGVDNSLKMWIYDQQDGGPRLLRQRAGHSHTPTQITYYATSSVLLSGSSDKTFRMFSVIKDARSREFSQRTQQDNKRLPPIIGLAYAQARQRYWDNIVTCHEGSKKAHVWSISKFTIGKHELMSTHKLKPIITAVALSQCGSFVFIGSDNGWIDGYNIQSGNLRTNNANFHANESMHTGRISGLHANVFNTFIVSTSKDGTIKIWNFDTHKLECTIVVGSEHLNNDDKNNTQTPVDSAAVIPLPRKNSKNNNNNNNKKIKKKKIPIMMSNFQKESNLLAVVTNDLIIRVYDILTRQLVRKFVGHRDVVTAMCFSTDSRWIISADNATHVRLWDLPSGRCIDWFRVEFPITSMSFSPRSDFLATAHTGSNGIYIWANACYYSTVNLRPIPAEVYSSVPIDSLFNLEVEDDQNEDTSKEKKNTGNNDNDEDEADGEADGEADDEADDDPDEDSDHDDDNELFGDETDNNNNNDNNNNDNTTTNDMNIVDIWEQVIPKDQLSKELVTLSRQPRSKWQTFLNLDIITERNKPVQPPVPAPKAPFFLPVLPGLEPTFVPAENSSNKDGSNDKSTDGSDKDGNSKFLKYSHLRPKTKLLVLLEEGKKTGDYSLVTPELANMSPAAIDFEIKSLSAFDDCLELKLFLFYVKNQLDNNTNFEVAQSLLNAFLKEHTELAAHHAELSAIITEINLLLSQRWSKIDSLLKNNLCLLNFFAHGM